MEETKLIMEIIEITAYFDDEGNVWGRDTGLGTSSEIIGKVKNKIKHLIISPLIIEKQIADMINTANRRVLKSEIELKEEKKKVSDRLFQLDIKEEKKMLGLRKSFHIMNKEYNKLLRAWYKLKYGKPLTHIVDTTKEV